MDRYHSNKKKENMDRFIKQGQHLWETVCIDGVKGTKSIPQMNGSFVLSTKSGRPWKKPFSIATRILTNYTNDHYILTNYKNPRSERC